MIDKYVLASNDDGDLAVRTVQATESSSVTDTTSVITATDDGKLAVRVVGSGGGDQHNLGWYATEAALESAHATANDGDWAIVGATDTVWVWDSDSTGWKDTGAAGIELPDQTGQSGKFLTTNGATASWGTALTNTSAASGALGVLGTAEQSNTTAVGYDSHAFRNGTIAVGKGAHAGDDYSIAIGFSSKVSDGNSSYAVAIGNNSSGSGASAVAIGGAAKAYAHGCIQLGGGTNTEAGTFYVATKTAQYGAITNYKLMDSDGTIPEARLADTTNAAQGQVLALDSNLDAVWTTPSGGGLPSQTGNAGKFLTTDGTDASWSDKPLVNTATGNYSMCIGQTGSSASGQNSLAVGSFAQSANRSVAVGAGAVTTANYTTAIGNQAGCYGGQGAVAIGAAARANAANAIQIAATNNVSVNSDANTFKVANANGNFEMMDANGTIPTARLTKVNSTITLTAAGWSSNTQTVTVTGMTATGVVMVSPDPTGQSAYTSAGIICTAQAADSLTFTCSTTPSADIDVSVVML